MTRPTDAEVLRAVDALGAAEESRKDCSCRICSDERCAIGRVYDLARRRHTHRAEPVELGAEERMVLDTARDCIMCGAFPPIDGIVCALRGEGLKDHEIAEACAQRLRLGQAQYGLLDLRNDKRDFRAEVIPELLDALVYLACADVQAQLRSESGASAAVALLEPDAATERRATELHDLIGPHWSRAAVGWKP